MNWHYIASSKISLSKPYVANCPHIIKQKSISVSGAKYFNVSVIKHQSSAMITPNKHLDWQPGGCEFVSTCIFNKLSKNSLSQALCISCHCIYNLS